jgi:hypothetical protein
MRGHSKSYQRFPVATSRILGRVAGEALPFPSSSLLAREAIGVATALWPFRKALEPAEAGTGSHVARTSPGPCEKRNAPP